jgi:opacity protein-like surface antigen
MTERKLLAAAVAALSLASAPAFAADVLVSPAPRVVPAPIEVGGGWYLRGDVGVGMQSFRDVTITPPAPGFRVVQNYMEDALIVGGGFGYQFNDWFRFDATMEYRGNQGFGYLLNNTGAFGQFNNYRGHMSSVVGLLNAYFDIGNFYGLTPFVGAGVGFAHNRFSGFQDVGFIGAGGGFGFAQNTTSTQLAWALHAGVAYAVTDNLKLELSYRYLNMGGPNAGAITCQGVPPGCTNSFTLRDMDSHDFRVGMRWSLGAPPAAVPVMAPRPVIARN